MSDASPLVRAHLGTLREAAERGAVVDLACGRGRNALAVATAGVPVVGVDRNAEHLGELCVAASQRSLPVRVVRADLELAPHLPIAPGRCGAVIVCRYLHRPLAAQIESLLAPGGWLLYETFTIHQREIGYGPKNASFLLEPGELATLFPSLVIREHWEGISDEARPAAVARLVAQRRA